MTKTEKNGVDHLLEILADEATFGLGAEQDDLLKAIPNDLSQHQRDEMMNIAGLTQLSFLKLDANACQDMPEHVRDKILTKADEFFAKQGANENSSKVVNMDEFRPANEYFEKPAPRRNMTAWIGWSVAAGLLITLLVNRPDFVEVAAPRTPTIVQQRVGIIENAPDAIQLPWQTTDDFSGQNIEGDVVWSNSQQQGFLRLAGLPANDPAISQYQLWIIDPSRDSNPVDGGVFDVSPGVDETIIAIDAKLRISDPAAFAVTREKPGGTVVSASPLLIIAAVKG